MQRFQWAHLETIEVEINLFEWQEDYAGWNKGLEKSVIKFINNPRKVKAIGAHRFAEEVDLSGGQKDRATKQNNPIHERKAFSLLNRKCTNHE